MPTVAIASASSSLVCARCMCHIFPRFNAQSRIAFTVSGLHRIMAVGSDVIIIRSESKAASSLSKSSSTSSVRSMNSAGVNCSSSLIPRDTKARIPDCWIASHTPSVESW